MTARRYELTDFEWSIIAPLLPNKPRGVPRADDRRVLNGIYWRLRTGSPGRISGAVRPRDDLLQPVCRWRKQGVWDRIFDAVSKAYDGDLQMVNSPRSAFISTRPTSKGGPQDAAKGTTLQPMHGALARRTDDRYALVDANGIDRAQAHRGPSLTAERSDLLDRLGIGRPAGRSRL